MVIVRFVQHSGSYNPGDVAGYTDAGRAAELVAAGVAVRVEEPAPAPVPAVEARPNHRAVMAPGNRRKP